MDCRDIWKKETTTWIPTTVDEGIYANNNIYICILYILKSAWRHHTF